MGQKSCRNCSISHGLEVIKGFVFSSLIKIWGGGVYFKKIVFDHATFIKVNGQI